MQAKKSNYTNTCKAKPGDSIIFTKYAASLGTAILALLLENELLEGFGKELIERSKSLLNSNSVINDGILAAKYNVSSIHDVAKGGVLAVLWEIGTSSGYGFKVEKIKIPILEETRKICNYLSIDPLRLISTGSMIITTPNGDELLKILHNNDIKASEIGFITFEKEFVLIDEGNYSQIIDMPETDELYKALKMKGMIG